MNDITFSLLDPSNEDDVKRAAYIHQNAPREWKENFTFSEERLRRKEEVLRAIRERPHMYVLLAKDEKGKIIGLHWIEKGEKYNEICGDIISLWVDPAFRRKGIGKRLKVEGEKWAKEVGAQFIVTEVAYTNQKMLDFNIKLGFKARQVEMVKEL